MRYATIFLFFLLPYSIYSQDSTFLKNKLYIGITLGTPIYGNSRIDMDGYKMQLQSEKSFYRNYPICYIFKNGIGIYSSIRQINYQYSFTDNSLMKNNLDFKVLYTDYFLNYHKLNFNVGVGYRFMVRRLVLIPNICIGINNIKYTFGDALLKQNNSNLIRHIVNLSSLDYDKVSFTSAINICYFLTKHFGLSMICDYEHFNPIIHSQFDVKDYNSESKLTMDSHLNQCKIFVYFGLFVGL